MQKSSKNRKIYMYTQNMADDHERITACSSDVEEH